MNLCCLFIWTKYHNICHDFNVMVKVSFKQQIHILLQLIVCKQAIEIIELETYVYPTLKSYYFRVNLCRQKVKPILLFKPIAKMKAYILWFNFMDVNNPSFLCLCS